MPQNQLGQRRVAAFPVTKGKKSSEKWGVLEIQQDGGERLVSPPFDDEKSARKWWEKNIPGKITD